jgi:type II secretory pathway pseudopilin PulG
MKRKPAVFTLVELLVVIGIIMILSALLFPSLRTAKERGKQITCANLLKQTGVASENYSNDYNDYLVPVFMTSSLRWYSLLNRQFERADSNYSIFRCPAWDGAIPGNITYVIGLNIMTHGWNEAVYGNTYPMHKRGYLRKPSNSLSAADNMTNFNYLINGVNDLSFRHLGRVNAIYQDAHAESLDQNGLAGNADGNISKILTIR